MNVEVEFFLKMWLIVNIIIIPSGLVMKWRYGEDIKAFVGISFLMNIVFLLVYGFISLAMWILSW